MAKFDGNPEAKSDTLCYGGGDSAVEQGGAGLDR